MTAIHQMRWPFSLVGAILLATCSSPATERGRDAAAGAAASDAKAAAGGRTGTGGATRLGPDATVLGGAFGRDAGPSVLGCREEGAPCEDATDCCAGSTCATTSTEPGGYHCKRNCTAHGECPTGCCAQLTSTAISVCLDRAFCPSVFCHQEEQACADNYTCCEGFACAVFDPQTSACKPVCKQNTDCQTGCCVPLGKTEVSVCLDAIYCRSVTCHQAEEACAGDYTCCDGLICVVLSTTPVTGSCKTICASNQDCPTGCCALLGTGMPGACLDKSYCSRAH